MTTRTNKTSLNKSLVKPVALTAGVIGLIQGIAWTVFSVLCICCYGKIVKIDDLKDDDSSYYQIMYSIFLSDDENRFTGNGSIVYDADLIVKPKEFFIFMLFYVVFSVIWLCVSAGVIWAMIRDKWNLTKCMFGALSTTTFLISIVDVVLTSLIGRDYSIIDLPQKNENDLLVVVAYGIMMSLAARGYVLWFVNVIFAIIFLKFTLNIVFNENQESPMPIIHGYEPSEANPPWFNSSVEDLWSSPQTPKNTEEYDNPGFTRSDSFFPASASQDNTYSSVTNNNDSNSFPLNNDQVTNNNKNNLFPFNFRNPFSGRGWGKGATAGNNKEHKTNDLDSFSGPPIPDPDYTPPNSPNFLKSVLRSKSNYT